MKNNLKTTSGRVISNSDHQWFTIICLFMICFSKNLHAQQDLKLWYRQPADHFEETLVLGNGKMGATVYGGIETDKILLNDITLWSGGPVNPYMNAEAYKHIPAIRDALKNEDYKLADELQHFIQGKFSESYAPLGMMVIHSKFSGEALNYHRELDLSKALCRVKFSVNDIQYHREYFVSRPDQIMVIRFSADKKRSVEFDIKLNSLLNHAAFRQDGILSIAGYAPGVAKPNYLGEVSDAVKFDENTGTRFSSMIRVINKGGDLIVSDSMIRLTRADEAIILVSVATSFNGFDKDPVKQGLDHHLIAKRQLEDATGKTYNQLLKDHILDYQRFYNRVTLFLGSSSSEQLPTNERLKRYATGAEDKYLEVLYFQYGRYLLISSSGTAGVPANLQGLWNPYMRPPWSSNYTTNINVEENYWLAENTNLSEMHTPLLTFIKNLSITGAVTAKTFLGVNGWTVCHNSDIWAMTNPVGDFGKGDPVWANWYLGGAWLSTHLWEHYMYTQDKEWLRTEGYDLMKGAAQFCLDWLVEDKAGHLITSPSTSPENKYITPAGYHGATLYGGTADIAMARECMQATADACRVLNTDDAFREKLEDAIKRLRPYQIGKNGQLIEWYYDWEDEDPRHRHQSHLFGLYPGHQISPSVTPQLAQACKKTLEMKGDETTGWSKGWRINLWARLGDGNHAYKMYRELLRYVEPDAIRSKNEWGGGTYPNLFDAHPPFQIDGNFGGAAAVAEMLVQSSEKEIILMPALPDAWSEGMVKGLCARGGFEISMEWKGGKLVKAVIKSKAGNPGLICYGGRIYNLQLKAGREKVLVFKQL